MPLISTVKDESDRLSLALSFAVDDKQDGTKEKMYGPSDSLMSLSLPVPAHGPHLCVSPSFLFLILLFLTLANMTHPTPQPVFLAFMW